MKLCLVIAALLVTSGCTLSAESAQCKRWREDGLMYGTQSSCVKCARVHGTNNPDVIAGCALGMDAANLFGG